MDIDDEMTHMIDRYNQTKIYELELTSGLKWLGADGPIYRCDPIAVRALFVGKDGRHWGDAGLAIESGWPDTEVRDCLWEMFTGGDSELFETWIFTMWRGRHSALIVPIAEIADVLDLGEPQRSTDRWARMWGTLPNLTDNHERQMVAYGATEIVSGLW